MKAEPEGAKRPTAGDEPREFTSRGEGGRVPPFFEKLQSPQLKGRTLVSSDKYMFRLVDGQYSEFEKFHVPKPVCLALHGFDFVVHPLQWAC